MAFCGVVALGTKLQAVGLVALSAVALEVFSPGLFSNVVQKFRIDSLIRGIRKEEQQESDLRVEELVATVTPAPNQKMIPGGL